MLGHCAKFRTPPPLPAYFVLHISKIKKFNLYRNLIAQFIASPKEFITRAQQNGSMECQSMDIGIGRMY
jgi:hypothetical protein